MPKDFSYAPSLEGVFISTTYKSHPYMILYTMGIYFLPKV